VGGVSLKTLFGYSLLRESFDRMRLVGYTPMHKPTDRGENMSQNKAYIVRGPHAWGMADKRTTAIKKARANLPRKGSAYYTKKGRPVLLQVLEHDTRRPVDHLHV